MPRHGFEIRHADRFRERRNLGQRGQPSERGLRKRTQLAITNQRKRYSRRGEGERHVSGRDIGDGLRAILIRHMSHVDAEALLQIFRRQVRHAADR